MALRQRRGETTSTTVDTPTQEKPQSEEEIVELFQQKMRSAMELKVSNEAQDMKENLTSSELNRRVDEGLSRMFEPKKKPLSGLKHETKAAKDALDNDPYNLQLIFELGEGYIKEEKFSHAANVLIRGWKRMSEIQDHEMRFLFLAKLCHASNEDEKYKQAEAVLEDMEVPEDGMKIDYFRLKTKVYANNNNMQKALKAFHEGLSTCKDLEEAMPLWVDTLSSLKKVGAYDVAKSAIENLASSEDDKKKLQVMESFCELRATLAAQAPKTMLPRLVVGGFVSVCFCLIMYLLYVLESKSLSKLNLTK